ncbi:ferritin-like domain-containing protein [Flavobacterium sp. '19STA2R22 D10 B1']|uniref:ferritin-like domain-containing protein n=1 Tax=Flavobacterium aerium TaxID=3037261 RepID=UPI00278C1D30|nr:ferritin-like domain-containing protein [Flavobacterium sp. '19STA2R22 D10 B1']
MKNVLTVETPKPSSFKDRRSFLKISGLAMAGTGLLLMGCNNDDDSSDSMNGIFDLGSGDLGVLNYAYALEQLEADFYTKVVNSFYSGISEIEKQLFTDLYHHELIHRDFFKTAITAAAGNINKVLPTLQFNYGSLNFSNRDQVLATAMALEDTGVAAYNGAGKLITNPEYLLLAGKIVSVEARHASAIRSLINPNSNSFAGDDIVNSINGLDVAKNPSEILGIAKQFITTPFTANSLP